MIRRLVIADAHVRPSAITYALATYSRAATLGDLADLLDTTPERTITS